MPLYTVMIINATPLRSGKRRIHSFVAVAASLQEAMDSVTDVALVKPDDEVLVTPCDHTVIRAGSQSATPHMIKQLKNSGKYTTSTASIPRATMADVYGLIYS